MERLGKYSAVIKETVAKCRSREKVTRPMVKKMLKESMRQRGYFSQEDLESESLLGSLVTEVIILLEEED